MPYINLNKTDCYYEDSGGQGDVILFLHGLFLDGRMFASQVEALKDKYRCICLDWRSQGRSEIAKFGHDADGLVNDIKVLIEKLNIANCHIVGVSVGGVIAIRLAAQFPKIVKSIVGIGSAANGENIETLNRYEQIMASFAQNGPVSVIDTLMPLIFGPDFNQNPARKADFDNWRNHILANNGLGVGRAAAPILRRVDIFHMLSEVKCPSLFIVGEFDYVNNVEKCKKIVDGIKGAKMHILQNSGHTPPIENPTALNEVLQGFYV